MEEIIIKEKRTKKTKKKRILHQMIREISTIKIIQMEMK